MFREGPQEISLVKLDPSGQVKINNSSSNGPEVKKIIFFSFLNTKN